MQNMKQCELHKNLRMHNVSLTKLCDTVSESYGANIKAKHIINRFEGYECLTDYHSVVFRQYFDMLKLKEQNRTFRDGFKDIGLKIGFVL